MSVKFFGQFLVERGEIDAGQIREALALMRAQNRTLGEIAIQQAFLSEAEAREVNDRQRVRDRHFGELAVEMGLLTEDELERALRLQADTHLLLGEALVRLGHLGRERLGPLLDLFKADQALYERSPSELPGPLGDHPVAVAVLDLLPKLCRRVAVAFAKIGPGEPLSDCPELEHGVGLAVRGCHDLDVYLLADDDFAREVGAATVRLDPRELQDDLVDDALAEFLNVVGGSAVAVLEREGAEMHLSEPRLDARPSSGIGFELVVPTGRAQLVLARA